MMMSGKLMLIDGNSIMNRAFYGLRGPQLLAASDGLYTNAVFGFVNIMSKFIEEENPQYLCVAFDLKAPTFRHKEFDGYKAKRKGMPDELAVQMPVIKDVLDAMGILRMELEGYEADDILGWLSQLGETKGLEVVIISGDRDSLQLASSLTRIKIPVTRGGKTETEEYDYQKVLDKYGVTPRQLIDVKGLMGDSSDNIPGVPGIGEKTAFELIRRFIGLEQLYEHIEAVEKKRVKEKLESNRELAFLSRRLATIDRNIPHDINLEDMKRREFDKQRLYQLFKKLEFKSFIDKFGLCQSEQKEAPTKEIQCVSGLEEIDVLKKKIIDAGKFSIYHLLDKTEDSAFKLSGISFTWEEGDAVYLDLRDTEKSEKFLAEFKDILENPDIKKFGHDIKGLIVYFKNKGIQLAGLAFDTMIAAYILNPSRETYSLAELAHEYAKMEIKPVEELSGRGKSFVPFSAMPLEQLSSVAGMHSETIFKLVQILGGIIEENDQHFLYYEIELPLVEVLADMEYHGFKVNIDVLKSFSGELEEKILELTRDIYGVAGEEFNINSTKQLGVILFEKLGLPVLKKTKTGYSTDAEVLEQLAARHEIVSKILEYRQLVKLRSTYVEGLLNVINPLTGKIHSSFNQTVAVTGRISSTEPNLQNIPVKLEMGRKIRKFFVPTDEKYILADADYSQIELRVLAHIAGDGHMMDAFMHNEDIHTATASQVFGVPKDQVTPLLRSRAKAVNFGIVYGIGDFSLSKDLGITRKEARKYIDGYLDNYPGVRKYMHDTVEEGKNKGFVTTLFNRRRYLPELKSSNFNIRSFGERIAMNTPIQGSAADIIKIAMVKVYRELKEKKMRSRLILQVHDELLIETFVDETREVQKILKESMERAADLRVPLLVEVKTGNNWYETK